MLFSILLICRLVPEQVRPFYGAIRSIHCLNKISCVVSRRLIGWKVTRTDLAMFTKLSSLSMSYKMVVRILNIFVQNRNSLAQDNDQCLL